MPTESEALASVANAVKDTNLWSLRSKSSADGSVTYLWDDSRKRTCIRDQTGRERRAGGLPVKMLWFMICTGVGELSESIPRNRVSFEAETWAAVANKDSPWEWNKDELKLEPCRVIQEKLHSAIDSVPSKWSSVGLNWFDGGGLRGCPVWH